MAGKRNLKEGIVYYAINKALESGEEVRLKNGVYALDTALADTMIDVERLVPRGVLCLYSAWTLWPFHTDS